MFTKYSPFCPSENTFFLICQTTIHVFIDDTLLTRQTTGLVCNIYFNMVSKACYYIPSVSFYLCYICGCQRCSNRTGVYCLPVSDNVCRLLITFVNSLDPYQDLQNFGPQFLIKLFPQTTQKVSTKEAPHWNGQ